MPRVDVPTPAHNLSDSARLLGMSREAVRALIESGDLKTVEVPGCKRRKVLAWSLDAYYDKLYGQVEMS